MGFVLTTLALTTSGIGGQDEPSTAYRGDIREHIPAVRAAFHDLDGEPGAVPPLATADPTPDAGTPPEPVPDATEAEPQRVWSEPAPVEALSGGRAALVELVKQVFPDDESMWRHVVWAESIGDWNPNWECTVYGGCWSPTQDCGLLQTNMIHAGKYAKRGWDINVDCFDPVKNLEVAREIYDTQGPGAWTTYR